jgi:hypothetical protein
MAGNPYEAVRKLDKFTGWCEDFDLLAALIPIAAPSHAPVEEWTRCTEKACDGGPDCQRSVSPEELGLAPKERLKAGQHVFTSARWVHLRSAPGSDADLVDDVFLGTELVVASTQDAEDEALGWVKVFRARPRVLELDLRQGLSKAGPAPACRVLRPAPATSPRPATAWVATSLVTAALPDAQALIARADQAEAAKASRLALMLLDRASALLPEDEALRRRVVKLAMDEHAVSIAAWASASGLENLISGDIAAGCRGDRRRAEWVDAATRASAGRDACLRPKAYSRPCVREFYDDICGITACDEWGAADPPPDPARDEREKACLESWEKGEAARRRAGKVDYAAAVRAYGVRVARYQQGFNDGPWVRLVARGMRAPSDKRLFVVVGQQATCTPDACFGPEEWSLPSKLVCDAGPALHRGETVIIWARIPSADGATATVLQGSPEPFEESFFEAGGETQDDLLDGTGVMAPVQCPDIVCAATEETHCACSAD